MFAELGPEWLRMSTGENDVLDGGWDLARLADEIRFWERREKQVVGANLPDEGRHFCQWQRAQHKPRAAAPRRVSHGGRTVCLGQCERKVLDGTPRERAVREGRGQQCPTPLAFKGGEVEQHGFAWRRKQTSADHRMTFEVLLWGQRPWNLDDNAGRRAIHERPAVGGPCVARSALRAGVSENGVEEVLVCWDGTTSGGLLLLWHGDVHRLLLLGRLWCHGLAGYGNRVQKSDEVARLKGVEVRLQESEMLLGAAPQRANGAGAER